MALEHPSPTAATAKLLYGRAFICACPGCNQPLYKEDDTSGTWALNSRICHINARREGGPRWDNRQSADDNRADQNLLLLCHEHASGIDDPKALDAYPAELLRQWKQAQIDDHRRRMSGWQLTGAMADDAIEASFSNVGIAFNRSTVHLGGEGGRAPSAGGGGGGAIGKGARAGRGGDGGKHHDLGLEDILQAAGFEAEVMPGAGGGGSGAIGEGAIAGDGGSGGDSLSAIIAVEPGDYFDIEINDGGKGAALPGQHGMDGGDTILHHRATDGSLKRTIRAKGGSGGKSGRLPDNTIEISEADLTGGFQISTLLPVNAAEMRDGLVSILGGGWGIYNVEELPVSVGWSVFCAATWKALERSAIRGVQLCIIDPQGRNVSSIVLEISLDILAGTNCNWLANIGVVLDREGRWTVRVQSGQFLLSEIEVEVKLIPSS